MATRSFAPLLASVAALALAGCSTGTSYQDSLTGLPAQPTPQIFRTMHDGIGPIGRYASMTVVSPEWALTNDHADGIASGLRYEAPQADLALVHIEGGDPLPRGTAKAGDHVTLFGTGVMGERRVAYGTILDTNAFVCWGKPSPADASNACKDAGMGVERAIVLSSNSGDGFSGGPIINDRGELVGLIKGPLEANDSGEVQPVATGGAVVGQLFMDSMPHAAPGQDVTVGYPIAEALSEFFPAADPAQPVLASAKPAEPASWLARWGWVVLLVVI